MKTVKNNTRWTTAETAQLVRIFKQNSVSSAKQIASRQFKRTPLACYLKYQAELNKTVSKKIARVKSSENTVTKPTTPSVSKPEELTASIRSGQILKYADGTLVLKCGNEVVVYNLI